MIKHALNSPTMMSLAETTHAIAITSKVTAVGIARQNAMAARFMFHKNLNSYWDPLVSETIEIEYFKIPAMYIIFIII